MYMIVAATLGSLLTPVLRSALSLRHALNAHVHRAPSVCKLSMVPRSRPSVSAPAPSTSGYAAPFGGFLLSLMSNKPSSAQTFCTTMAWLLTYDAVLSSTPLHTFSPPASPPPQPPAGLGQPFPLPARRISCCDTGLRCRPPCQTQCVPPHQDYRSTGVLAHSPPCSGAVTNSTIGI